MSVNPGYGGQSFMMSALDKIKTLKEIIVRESYQVLIEVDGGINDETAKLVLDAGADVLVAGSYIFKQDITETIEKLWNLK
jgi:ribulose-phosphate 3-epimerase